MTAKKPRARTRTKQRRAIWKRTQMLVEIMIEAMEAEMDKAGHERSEQWLHLFGNKDSALVNLQKLVQLMNHLQDGAEPDRKEKVAPVDPEEMAILTAWLKAQSVQ